MTRLRRSLGLATVLATSVVTAVALTGLGAQAAEGNGFDAPSSIVEDFSYPDAAAILAEQNVKLISGDGHIVLADCAVLPTGDIGLLKVWTTGERIGTSGLGQVCFKVLASKGLLNLEVPGVYEIRGDGQRAGTGHEVVAKLETDAGEKLSVDVDPDGSTPVGLGANPENLPTMLLQLQVNG